MTVETLPHNRELTDNVEAMDPPELVGLLAEYTTVDDVFAAGERVRNAGYTRWDIHAPFPIHGVDEVLGMKPTILPWIVLAAGLTGMATGLFLTLWTMTDGPRWAAYVQGYPYLISGKPLASLPAYIPPIFELTILFSGIATFLGMWLLNSLPMLYSPLSRIPRFRRATDDRFFIVIDASDPKFQNETTTSLLEETRPVAVERVLD